MPPVQGGCAGFLPRVHTCPRCSRVVFWVWGVFLLSWRCWDIWGGKYVVETPGRLRAFAHLTAKGDVLLELAGDAMGLVKL